MINESLHKIRIIIKIKAIITTTAAVQQDKNSSAIGNNPPTVA
jgi:hypothetical protein